MKNHVQLLLVWVMATFLFGVNLVYAEDPKLIGVWKLTVPSKDESGKPCPFVPDSMEYFKDQTMVMSNFGSQHLPYKTTLSKDERMKIDQSIPAFKGKGVMLIKPNPNMDWLSTPMKYAYTIKSNELTLILQGYTPAKFKKQK